MRVSARLLRRYYTWANRRWGVRLLPCRNTRPVISFSFDDFPRSAYFEGAPILEQYGVRGTYYTAFGLAGTDYGNETHFDMADVIDLASRGHEIACHTYKHEIGQLVRASVYRNSIDENCRQARRAFGDIPWQCFAYPQGSVTPTLKKMVQSRFRCGRGVAPGINRGKLDANELLANSMYSRNQPVAKCLPLIQDVAEQGGWLIFYTHDVCDKPSPYGCTPDEFRTIVAAAAESGAQLLSVGEAIDVVAPSGSPQRGE